jgi:hypothetical protein
MRTFVSLTVAAATALMLLFPTAGCAGPPMGAHFEKRQTTVTDTFETGASGGTFASPSRGLPTDGVRLQLPERAVDRTISLSLGYSKGEMHVAAGIPSGVVLAIGAAPADRFEQPLKISVTFQPSAKYQTLVGYAIDEQGRFHTIDIVDLDMKEGRVSFLTFQPLTFTWVYVER